MAKNNLGMNTSDAGMCRWTTAGTLLAVLLGLCLFGGQGTAQQKPKKEPTPSPAKQREIETLQLYDKAVSLYGQGKLAEAQELFLKVKQSGVYLGFFKSKELESYLQKIEYDMKKGRASLREDMIKKYDEAVKLYKEKQYGQANVLFREIEKSGADLGFFKNRALKTYLAKIEEELKKRAPVARPPAEKPKPAKVAKAPAEKPKPPAEKPKPPAEKPKPAEVAKPPAEKPKPPAEKPKPAEVAKPPAEKPKPPAEKPKPAEVAKPPAEKPKPPAEKPKPAEVAKPPAEKPKPPAAKPTPEDLKKQEMLKLFNEGLALYEKGNYEDAAKAFETVLASKVDLGFFNMAKLRSRLADARNKIAEAKKPAPPPKPAPEEPKKQEMLQLYSKGLALYDDGKYEEAVKAFETVLASKVDLGFWTMSKLKSKLGSARDKIQKVEEKKQAETQKKREQEMQALFERGMQLYEQEKYAECVEAMKQVKASGVDLGWWNNRKLAKTLKDAEGKLAKPPVAVAKPDKKAEYMAVFEEAEAHYKAEKWDGAALLYKKIKDSGVDLGKDVNRTVDAHLADATKKAMAERKAAAAPPTLDKRAQDFLEKMAKEKKIAAQKNRAIADHYYGMAKKAYNETSYVKAKEYLEKALKFTPDHREAQELLQRTNALLGVPEDKYKVFADKLAEEKAVRIQQKKLEMENALREGVRLLKAERYDDALDTFEEVIALLNFLRSDIDVTPYENHVEALIQLATKRKKEYEVDLGRRREQEARTHAMEVEEREKEITEEKLKTMYEQAYSAFLKERYDDVKRIGKDILREDPGNAAVEELMERAKIEQDKKTWEKLRKADMEETEKNRQYLKDAIIPRSDIMGYPSDDVWEKITERDAVAFPEVTSDLTESERALEEALDERRVDVAFEATPITDVVNFLRTLVGLNMVLDPEVAETSERLITLDLKDVTLRSALKNICGNDLTFMIKNEAIWITSTEAAGGDLIVLVYDVRDLLLAVIDRPRRPNILGETGTTGGAGGAGLDFGAGGAAGGGISRTATGRDRADIELQERGEELIKLLVKITGPDVWSPSPAYIVGHLAEKEAEEELGIEIEGGDGQGTVAFRDGDLIVKQTKDVHEQIRIILARMRESLYLQVTIDCRFLSVSDDFLEEVGTDIQNLMYRQDRARTMGLPEGATTDPNAPYFGYPFTPTYQQWANPWMQERFFTANPTPATSNQWLNTYWRSVRKGWYGLGAAAGAPFTSTQNASLATVMGSPADAGMNLGFAILDSLQAALLIKAVQDSNEGSVLASPRLTVFNTQRANVSVGQSYAYIADADVGNQGALDPEIDFVTSRTSLDIRPIVSADRRYVYLELFPERLILQPPADATAQRPFRLVPITSIVVTGNLAVATTMSIELPQQAFEIVETTVVVPDRGHLLVGGMATVTEREVETGVPVLKNLPLVKRLFSRHSTIKQRTHLLILLHPTILVKDELEDEVF